MVLGCAASGEVASRRMHWHRSGRRIPCKKGREGAAFARPSASLHPVKLAIPRRRCRVVRSRSGACRLQAANGAASSPHPRSDAAGPGRKQKHGPEPSETARAGSEGCGAQGRGGGLPGAAAEVQPGGDARASAGSGSVPARVQGVAVHALGTISLRFPSALCRRPRDSRLTHHCVLVHFVAAIPLLGSFSCRAIIGAATYVYRCLPPPHLPLALFPPSRLPLAAHLAQTDPLAC